MNHRHFLCLIGLITIFPLAGCQSGNQTEEAKPLSIQAVQVRRMTIPDTLELNGIVNPQPNQSVKVAAVVPGLLTQVIPKAGDWVGKGQVVARLQQSVQNAQVAQASAAYQMSNANLEKVRTGSRQQEIEQAQANLNAAKASLANAQKNRERMQKLLEENIAAGKDVDAALSQEQTALAQVQAAQANLSLVLKGPRREDRQAAAAQSSQAAAMLSQAKANLSFTRVVSPISGVVAERYLNVGDQAGPATPIMLIVNPSVVFVQANLPVGYNARITPGQTVEIVPADGTIALMGRVLTVGVKVDPITNTIPIQIEASNAGQILKIGMTVKAKIILAEHPDALVLPKQCLISSSEQPDQYVVNRLDQGMSFPTRVIPGITSGQFVEIKSGLQAGQWVITNMGYELPAKTKVLRQ